MRSWNLETIRLENLGKIYAEMFYIWFQILSDFHQKSGGGDLDALVSTTNWQQKLPKMGYNKRQATFYQSCQHLF